MKLTNKILLSNLIAAAAISTAFADMSSYGSSNANVQVGNAHTRALLNNYRHGFGVNHDFALLTALDGASNGVYLNGMVAADVNHQSSDDAVYGLDGNKKSHSAFLTPEVKVAMSGKLNAFGGYLELGDYSSPLGFHNDCDTINSMMRIEDATFTADKINPVYVRQAYVTYSPMDQFFVALGKKTVDFGNFASRNLPVQSLLDYKQFDFASQLAVGLRNMAGFNAAVSVFNGGAQDLSGVYDSKDANNELKSMAATVSYAVGDKIDHVHNLNLGLSYSNRNTFAEDEGTGHNGTKYNDGMLDGFVTANLAGVDVRGEYLRVSGDKHDTAWEFGLGYDMSQANLSNNMLNSLFLNANYSKINYKGANNGGNLSRLIFAVGSHLSDNAQVVVEYSNTKTNDRSITGADTDHVNRFDLAAYLYF